MVSSYFQEKTLLLYALAIRRLVGFWLATYFVTLELSLCRVFWRVERGLNKARWGSEDIAGHIPLPGRGLFSSRLASSDDLDVSLSIWVHVLTRGSSASNPSNLDADVSTRGPADTCDLFTRVSTCFLYMNSLQPFSKFVCFFIANLSNQ